MQSNNKNLWQKQFFVQLQVNCALMLYHQGSFFETQMKNKKVKEKHLIIVLLNFYCA